MDRCNRRRLLSSLHFLIQLFISHFFFKLEFQNYFSTQVFGKGRKSKVFLLHLEFLNIPCFLIGFRGDSYLKNRNKIIIFGGVETRSMYLQYVLRLLKEHCGMQLHGSGLILSLVKWGQLKKHLFPVSSHNVNICLKWTFLEQKLQK